MNILVGVISPVPAWNLPRPFVDHLRAAFPRHTFLDAWDDQEIHRLLPQADVVFTPVVRRELFASALRLRWIQSPAVGVSHLLYPELVHSQVVLTTARGVRARAMAEHVMAVTLALARQLHTAVRHQVARQWSQDLIERSSLIRTLDGCRLGIVGLGGIGAEVANLAARFGLRVSAVRRRANLALPDGVHDVLPPERLSELLAASDIVVLAVPVTPRTDRLIGREEFEVMKPGAFLVNVGRGGLVDEPALIESLRSGRLGGAALDVFATEPLPVDSPLWDFPNVIITPHTSGAMEDYWTPLIALFSENLRRFERGEPLLNLVDKQAGY